MKISDFKPVVTVIGKGVVLGNCWGGGMASYASKTVKGDSVEQVYKEAKNMLKNGSLDGGMGFDGLIGAALTLHIITRIEIEGKEFENIEYDLLMIGDLTPAQEDFLTAHEEI